MQSLIVFYLILVLAPGFYAPPDCFNIQGLKFSPKVLFLLFSEYFINVFIYI